MRKGERIIYNDKYYELDDELRYTEVKLAELEEILYCMESAEKKIKISDTEFHKEISKLIDGIIELVNWLTVEEKPKLEQEIKEAEFLAGQETKAIEKQELAEFWRESMTGVK